MVLLSEDPEKRMKPFEFVDPAQQETSVFDMTPTGQKLFAERSDEPGDERPKPGDGSPTGEAHIAGLAKRIVGRLLCGDPEGDWSWKPRRALRVTGPACTCTVNVPVGTNCPRHDGTYQPPTPPPRKQTWVSVSGAAS